ncbi:GL19031 [Drosophila persimilis]|uniref:GL19031 n=1 Tax=Drosophila persimilis TaxID=7234 RepID=B4G6W2_DROPE|nr:GL19031 [Drosophila persimilis]
MQNARTHTKGPPQDERQAEAATVAATVTAEASHKATDNRIGDSTSTSTSCSCSSLTGHPCPPCRTANDPRAKTSARQQQQQQRDG